MQRKGILRVGMAVVLSLSIQAHTPGEEPAFELHELVPGVYAAEVVRNPPAYAFANSLVVIGTDGVLVVDTQQSLTAARALIAEIERLTDAPVRWVVNTHWHGDHVNGNQAYAAEYPGVEFIAHVSVAEDLRTLAAARRAAEQVELPASIEMRRQWLRDGVTGNGVSLNATDRAAVQRSLKLREAYSEELAVIEPTPPTRVLTDRLELTVGVHNVLLLHFGPAHTRGDVVVALPQYGIVAAGDLLEAGMPYFDDAYPAGWLRAVQLIDALQPATILPAHGPVSRDGVLLEDTRALLTLVTDEYARGRDDGASPDDAGTWHDMQQQWAERYGVSAAAFTNALQTAVSRARLEQEAR